MSTSSKPNASSGTDAPPDAPPSYAVATGSSTASAAQQSSRLTVPQETNDIPISARRSMEDLQRPLPEGWVRQYDPNENHQFFVDTRADPPKSYWEHPLDIPEVLKTLSSEERERLQDEENRMRQSQRGSADFSAAAQQSQPQLPPRPSSSRPGGQPANKSLGERLKDKVTGMNHEERERFRAHRMEEERRAYEAHVRLREAMQRAQMTGQPQFFAKDRDGKEIYIEPPQGPRGYGGYGPGSYGVNPYASGPYANPNARFIRPGYPYNRPYGTQRGGGMGVPVGAGLLGGLLLGGILF